MRYFRFKDETTVYKVEDFLAVLYERAGFTECADDGRPLKGAPAEKAGGEEKAAGGQKGR